MAETRKQTALWRSILDNMGDGVVVADENRRILVFNPAAERLFGPLQGDTLYERWPEGFGLYRGDRVTPFAPHELPLERSLRGEQVDELEMFVRHPQAPQGVWVSVTGRPLRDEQNQVKGGVIVYRDVTARKRMEQRLTAQHAATHALAQAPTLAEAAAEILQTLCEGLAWDLGALWVVDRQAQVISCLEVWHRCGLPVDEFVRVTRQSNFRAGVGLPGRVWASGIPAWIANVTTDTNFPRAPVAARAGLLGGYAFPIHSGAVVAGVIEFFNRTSDKPDFELLSMMASLGSQIGQVLERQRMAQALRESEAFYHSLVESLPHNIFRKDRDGRVTFGNQRYCATLKRSLAELIGKTDYDLFPAHLAAQYRADDERVLQSGQLWENVEEHRLPDGTLIHVQVIKTPIHDRDGNVIGTQGVFWDVTERKRAEEALRESERRYRQLTESTLDAIIVADQEGKIALFNPAAERLFGYEAVDLIGQPILRLIPPEYQERHRQGFARYLATRTSHIVGRTVEIHGRRKDGSTFPLELALSAIDAGGPRDDAGRPPVQFLGAIRDTTERNRIRAVLMQNEKLASIGLLSAGVAHEINNPLAFISNNLVVLERDSQGLMSLLNLYTQLGERLAVLDPVRAAEITRVSDEMDLGYLRANLGRLLSRTRDGVERVTRIVQSLSGLARTDTPEREETNLADLIETSLQIVRGRLKQRSIEVSLVHDPNPRVPCVSSQISQVLLNLLVNALQAIEATSRTQGQIRVRTQRLPEEMLIEVADNGCGIDEQHLPRLFDPFFTTKDVGEGTGLGLSISHNIVTAHGGRIEVGSQLGVGSRFRVFLPLHAVRDAQ